MLSGASTPIRSRQRAVTVLVAVQRLSRKVCLRRADHLVVVVEAVKVVGEPDRVRRNRVRRPPLGRLGDDARELEDPFHEIAFLGRQLAGQREAVLHHGRLRGCVAKDPGDAGMRVLDVEHGVLGRLLGRQVDVDVDRLIVASRDEVPAGRVDADLVDEVVQENNVTAALGHLRRLAAPRQMDELVDQDLERLARVAEHLGQRLQAADVPVVIGPEDVHEVVESLGVLPAHVGGIGRVVRRRPVGASEDAVLLVAVGRRPGPQGPVILVGVEQRDRVRDLSLDDALALERVEADPEALQRSLDEVEHDRHGVAVDLRELGDVVAVVAILRRLLAAAHRVDRGAEAVHLGAGIVVVVLALDRVTGEGEEPGDTVAVSAVACGGDGHRAGGVRRHHLDLDPLRRLGGAAAELVSCPEHAREACDEPRVGELEVDEARPGDRGLRDTVDRCCGLDELLRDLARRTARLAGELQRDVGGVVAVGRVCGPVERDRRPGSRRQRGGELLDGIRHRSRPRRHCPDRACESCSDRVAGRWPFPPSRSLDPRRVTSIASTTALAR